MKKITSEVPVSFRYDGSTLLEIDSEGCLASDAVAAVAKDRLGDQITLEDAGSDQGPERTEEEPEGPSYAELQAKAKELGLKASGSKEDIAARIAEHEAAAVAEPETPEAPAADAEAPLDAPEGDAVVE